MPKCKSKTKFLPATFAWVLLLGTTSLFFAFPCARWYVMKQLWYAVPVFQGILTLFVLVNFSMATFMDPGVIPRASPDEDRDDDFRAPLYRNVEINGITVRMKWCVTCQFYRPPRCSHCSVCNNCIEIFDHHCPWVNNCIGRRNYRYFFMFLISLSLHMTSIFIFCLVHVLHKKDELFEVPVIVSIVVMCVIALLFIPIFGLTGFHIVLVARGRTTNEQVTGKFRGGYNPFSKNCCYNCCFSLCGPQYPSLKHPAKYIGRKPRKYTVPVPIKTDVSNGGGGGGDNNRTGGMLPGPAAGVPAIGGGSAGPGGGPGLRASGRRGPGGQGVEPLAAQAAAAAQVRTYRDNGVKHSTSSYNRMSAASNELDPGSDVDEPMASVSKDSEPPLVHNNSKSNFFTEEDLSMSRSSRPDDSVLSRSTLQSTVQGYTPQQAVSSPYQQNHGRMLQQGYNSPHILQKPGKRSGTPEHMLGEVEMRALPRQTQSPTVTTSKVRSMGGIATPLAGAPPPPPPSVSSPGRYSGLTTPLYSHAPTSTTYNPGYQPSRRYLSEGELLEPQQMMVPQGVGPSTSAGHIQELAGSPNRSFYLWKTDGSPPVATYTSHQHMGPHHHPHSHHHGPSLYAGGGGGGPADPTSPHHPPPPGPAHSYAQQVGYYLQQQPPAIAADFLGGPPSLQSGGPRTTPSGYPGGPVVPGPAGGHLSPKMGRRLVIGGPGGHIQNSSSPYSSNSGSGGNEHVIRTMAPSAAASTSPPHQQQGPLTFTRALEVTDSVQQQQQQQVLRGGVRQPAPPPVSGGDGGGGENGRDSVYDMNYEISV